MEVIVFIVAVIFVYKLVTWAFKDDTPKEENPIFSRSSTLRPEGSSLNKSPSNRDTILSAIRLGKDVVIQYQNYNGETSSRRLSNLSINNEYSGYQNEHVKAFCHKRNEERNFKISRIIRAQIVE